MTNPSTRAQEQTEKNIEDWLEEGGELQEMYKKSPLSPVPATVFATPGEPEHGDRWGRWRFTEYADGTEGLDFLIDGRVRFQLCLDQIDRPEDTLDWIAHFSDKDYSEVEDREASIGRLVLALKSVLGRSFFSAGTGS